MELTHKDIIIRTLAFKPYYTTELWVELSKGYSIGVKSLTNRLTDLQKEGKVIGEVVEGRKEKRWKIWNGELFQ